MLVVELVERGENGLLVVCEELVSLERELSLRLLERGGLAGGLNGAVGEGVELAERHTLWNLKEPLGCTTDNHSQIITLITLLLKMNLDNYI